MRAPVICDVDDVTGRDCVNRGAGGVFYESLQQEGWLLALCTQVLHSRSLFNNVVRPRNRFDKGGRLNKQNEKGKKYVFAPSPVAYTEKHRYNRGSRHCNSVPSSRDVRALSQ